MPATIFSGSDVKTLKDNLSLNDKAKILPSSGSPAGGAGLAAPIGSLALDYTNGKTYKKIGALDTDWSELGSGIGGINYVTNTDAEAGTTGWSTYADAAGAQPVDGTGGSPSVTWTRSTTTPLRGTADFNFAKDAANRQGQGVATDITINLADQAKVLTVSFDYEILSGTYATGDLTVYLIQDPAGTPVVIQPAGYQVQSATAGTKMRQIATFQTAATGQSYRICFHVASTSASAYTLAIDNVICGPQVVQYGAPVTDWTAYTPTGSWVTNTTYAGYWRRVGDSIEVRARVSTSGAPTAASLTVSIPSGLSIDTTKAINTTATLGSLGIATINDSGLSTYTGVVQYQSTTSVSVLVNNAAGTYTVEADVTATVPFSFGASDKVDIFFSVPILGWGSTVQMSNDTDTRVVAARASGDPASATSGNPIIFPTTAFDTHGAYNSTTGRYTVSVPGYYKIHGAIVPGTGGAVGLFAYVNAVSVARAGNTDSNTAGVFTALVQVNAGDLIDIRPNATLDAGSGSVINFERLSGPSAIAASESVVAKYNLAAQVTSSSTAPINYATKVYDSHGAVTTGASWKFTAPISGKYRLDLVGASSTSLVGIDLYVNGSNLVTIGHQINDRLTSSGTSVSLVAGDYIDARYNSSQTTLSTSLTSQAIMVARIGN